MVEASQVPRKRQIQAWYICALLHYQGKVGDKEAWAVGLLRRHVSGSDLVNRWEFIEGLEYERAKEILDHIKPRLVRATAGDIKGVMSNAQASVTA